MNKRPKQIVFQGDVYTYVDKRLQYECVDFDGARYIVTEEFAKTSKLVRPVNFPYSIRPDIYAYDEPENSVYEKYTKYFMENSRISKESIGVDVGIGRTQEKKPVEQPKIDTTNYPRIQIEKMLYGDFRVQVWDKNLNSLLDREYFCCGFNSALQTAMSVKLDSNHKDFNDLPIYLYQDNKEKKLYD